MSNHSSTAVEPNTSKDQDKKNNKFYTRSTRVSKYKRPSEEMPKYISNVPKTKCKYLNPKELITKAPISGNR